MSNIGLELAFRESGIELVRTGVGDKYSWRKCSAGIYRLAVSSLAT